MMSPQKARNFGDSLEKSFNLDFTLGSVVRGQNTRKVSI